MIFLENEIEVNYVKAGSYVMKINGKQYKIDGQLCRIDGVDHLTSVIDGNISRVRVFHEGLNLHLFTQVSIQLIRLKIKKNP